MCFQIVNNRACIKCFIELLFKRIKNNYGDYLLFITEVNYFIIWHVAKMLIIWCSKGVSSLGENIYRWTHILADNSANPEKYSYLATENNKKAFQFHLNAKVHEKRNNGTKKTNCRFNGKSKCHRLFVSVKGTKKIVHVSLQTRSCQFSINVFQIDFIAKNQNGI